MPFPTLLLPLASPLPTPLPRQIIDDVTLLLNFQRPRVRPRVFLLTSTLVLDLLSFELLLFLVAFPLDWTLVVR